jgi:hypothetical protein
MEHIGAARSLESPHVARGARLRGDNGMNTKAHDAQGPHGRLLQTRVDAHAIMYVTAEVSPCRLDLPPPSSSASTTTRSGILSASSLRQSQGQAPSSPVAAAAPAPCGACALLSGHLLCEPGSLPKPWLPLANMKQRSRSWDGSRVLVCAGYSFSAWLVLRESWFLHVRCRH